MYSSEQCYSSSGTRRQYTAVTVWCAAAYLLRSQAVIEGPVSSVDLTHGHSGHSGQCHVSDHVNVASVISDHLSVVVSGYKYYYW